MNGATIFLQPDHRSAYKEWYNWPVMNVTAFTRKSNIDEHNSVCTQCNNFIIAKRGLDNVSKLICVCTDSRAAKPKLVSLVAQNNYQSIAQSINYQSIAPPYALSTYIARRRLYNLYIRNLNTNTSRTPIWIVGYHNYYACKRSHSAHVNLLDCSCKN